MIGIGTGSVYKYTSPASREAVDIIRDTGVNAVELNAVVAERLNDEPPSLTSLPASSLDGFDYVSMHAPNDVTYTDDTETHRLLTRIEDVANRLHLDRVVFHPDRIRDPALLAEYAFPVGIENMDARKPKGQTVSDLAPYFDDYGYGFVYDATHVYTNDETMNLGSQLLEAFADELVEVHCSGYYIHGDDEQQHFPTVLEEDHWSREERATLPHQTIFGDIPTAAPIIIESVLPDGTSDPRTILQDEYRYVRQLLQQY